MTHVTAAEIAAAQSPAGGWTKKQLAEWGIPWPPPRGWKKRLERQSLPALPAAALDDIDREIVAKREELLALKAKRVELNRKWLNA